MYFDGLCEPRNPGGVGAYGFVVYIDNRKVHEGYGVVGEGKGMSNNVAEFSGLVAALEWLLENGYSERIVVRGDSQLVINLMNCTWRAKGGMYYPYYLKAIELAKNFQNITFEWVPREQNEVADRLSREAYEEYCRAKEKKVRYMSKPAQRLRETCEDEQVRELREVVTAHEEVVR
ncbi:ribonuclease HI [Archaeoglobus neptunius]|uniref:ribonuclease HI n=1 Tax=Archaeoglobus neptunius TaxID=2798580 RepID=UPI002ED8CB75